MRTAMMPQSLMTMMMCREVWPLGCRRLRNARLGRAMWSSDMGDAIQHCRHKLLCGRIADFAPFFVRRCTTAKRRICT